MRTTHRTSNAEPDELHLVKIKPATLVRFAVDHGVDDELEVTLVCRDRRGTEYHVTFADAEFADLRMLVLNTVSLTERRRAQEAERLDTPNPAPAGS